MASNPLNRVSLRLVGLLSELESRKMVFYSKKKNIDFRSNQTITLPNVSLSFLALIYYSEIQLKTPNWLFGSRKPKESGSATKPDADDSEKGVTSSERVNDFCNLDWLSQSNDHQEDIFQRY